LASLFMCLISANKKIV